jgi:hypothetical protein
MELDTVGERTLMNDEEGYRKRTTKLILGKLLERNDMDINGCGFCPVVISQQQLVQLLHSLHCDKSFHQ